MLDANFHLKSRLRIITNDAVFGDGLSYYVRSGPYKRHLKDVYEEKDVSARESRTISWLTNFADEVLRIKLAGNRSRTCEDSLLL